MLCPENTFPPTTRRAYWTGTRRWPCSTKMTTKTTKTKTVSMKMTARGAKGFSPNAPGPKRIPISRIASGMRPTIEAVISRLMPLPMPRSVICSASHMIIAIPEVIVRMVSRRNPIPGNRTICA